MRSIFRSACVALLLGAAMCGAVSAQPTDPVAQRLGTMTLDEKVGQLLAIAFTPRDGATAAGFDKHVRDVRELGIGGVTFFRGSVGPVRECLAALSAAAKTPLAVMSDVEFGLPMRVNEGTRMPLNMAQGATGDPSLAYQAGRVTAIEARAVGIHVAFAPVVDVNNNPGNIIINTRSYGEDPAAVGRFGSAFIRGLQEHGVFATAKHYPGHGDTSVDSHLSLPTIDASRERLERVELAPFAAAVKAGVRCVMVGHITFSRVPEMKGRPASLDPHFVDRVLRGSMGFDGLVITDAMNMGGITEHYGHGEAAVMAIEAGVDVVLMPGDVRAAHAALVAAVKTGRLAKARLDASVERILRLKADAGLLGGGTRPAPGAVETVLRAPDHVAVAERIADRAVTLVADRRGVVPLAAERLRDVVVVTVTDERRGRTRGGAFLAEVRRRIPDAAAERIDPTTSAKAAAAIVSRAKKADAVVVAITVKWRDRKGSIALPDETVERLARLLRIKTPLVVVAFGSPYVLGQLPAAPAALCVYDPSTLAAGAAARALFGECAIGGRLPVSIPGRFARGVGLDRAARTMTLERALDDKRFRAAWSVLEERIEKKVFPGAQVAIVRDGALVASRGFGRLTYDDNASKVTTETVYDVASVTKVAATTTVAMVLADRGALDLDKPVVDYLPSFSGGGKEGVTVRHLLTHTSGLPAWAKLWSHGDRAAALAYIDGVTLASRPGAKAKYSDLGMITLGRVLERVGKAPLDELARDLVFAPLGMTHTTFRPPAAWRPRIAPTEEGGDLDRGRILGDVHDENAHFLGGVAGHAGVFSTAEDLAVLAQAYLDGGMHRHHRLFRPATVEAWTSRQNLVVGSSRALGWDTPSARGSLAGDRFSKQSFGHTGFTGTSIWVDRARRIAIVLLTNRVHPTRTRGGMREARRAFYNAAMKAAIAR